MFSKHSYFRHILKYVFILNSTPDDEDEECEEEREQQEENAEEEDREEVSESTDSEQGRDLEFKFHPVK